MGWGEGGQVSASAGVGGWGGGEVCGNLVGVDCRMLKGLGMGGTERKERTECAKVRGWECGGQGAAPGVGVWVRLERFGV